MRKPVIAAVNGPAAGAGAGLAFACDLRVAAASATFSMAFAGVALSADTGASFLLPRLVGHGRASAMMLLGEKVDAAEALRIGMVDQVVDDADLAGAVGGLADRLAAGPTPAFGWIKASLQHAASADLESTLAVRGPRADRLLRLGRSPGGGGGVRAEAVAAVHRKLRLSRPDRGSGHPMIRRRPPSSGSAVTLTGGTDG